MRRFLVLGVVMAVGLSAASLAAASASRASSTPGRSLLTNGSFELGTSGFTTEYSTTEGLGPAQTVGVGTNPSTLNGAWQPLADHTTGHGSMLVANGASAPGQPVWSETVGVAAGATYTWTAWVASLYPDPARLRFVVNGQTVKTLTAPSTPDSWAKVAFTWASGTATRAVLSIVDDNLDGGGNDFALDDLSFTGLGGGSARESTLASSIVSPLDALSSLKGTVENLAVAGGVVLFITFPSQLFNHTFDENYAEIRAWWVRRLGFLGRLRGARNAVRAASLGQRLTAAVVILVGGLLGGLLDPSFGLSGSSLVTFLSVVSSTVLGLVVAGLVGRDYRKRRGLDTSFHLHALPAGLAIAGLCVLVSRLAGFEPGYLYGLICGVAFGGVLARREAGHTVALGVLATIAVALAAWLVLWPLHRVGSEVWPLVYLEDLTGALFTGGIVGSMIGAFPLRFLPGGTVAAWHRGAWALLFGLVTFLFLELILDPGRGGHHGRAPLVTVIVLFVVFGGGSIAFYAYFARKKARRPETAAAAAAE